MGKATIINNTGNQAAVDYDYSKIFVRNNRFNAGLYDEPSSGDEYTLLAGTVMGRISATGKLKICSVASTDGSQFPVGVVKDDVTMASAATSVDVTICIAGDVVESKLLYAGSETGSSVVVVITTGPLATDYKRLLRDMIQTLGIILVGSSAMTKVDNA